MRPKGSVRILALILALSAAISAQAQQRCFVDLEVRSFPATIASLKRPFVTEDFDGDGHTDVAVLTGGGVQLHIGDGSGHLVPGIRIASGPGQLMQLAPQDLLAGDFDGDGIVDLALFAGPTTPSPFAGELTVFLGDGAGGLQPGTRIMYQTVTPVWPGAGDVDGDGIDDLVVPLRAAGGQPDAGEVTSTQVLLGGGPGVLSLGSTLLDGVVPEIVGDVNGDAAADLISMEPDPSGDPVVAVRLSDGLGAFGARFISPAERGLLTPDLVDFDSDGNPDILSTGFEDLFVQLGDGLGGFGPVHRTRTGPTPGCGFGLARAADFNQDGLADVAVHFRATQCVPSGAPPHGSISILLGDGQGDFDALFSFGQLSFRSPMEVGDFDSDGGAGLLLGSPGQLELALTSCFPHGGTNEDFTIETTGLDLAGTDPVKPLGHGEMVVVSWESPLGSFVGAPTCLASQPYPTGHPISSPPGHSAVHIDPLLVPQPVELDIDASLAPGGRSVGGIIPPGLAGSSLVLQAFAFSSSAGNGHYAATDAHHLRFVTRPPPVVTSGRVIDVATRTLEIFGAGFTTPLALTIDGATVAPTAVTSSRIEAALPAGMTGCQFAVDVVNADGQSASGFANGGVTVWIVDPPFASVMGGDTVTIRGSGFATGSTVTVGGTAASIISMSPLEIVIGVPPGSPGPTTVDVTALPGCTGSGRFTYAVHTSAPIITSVAPLSPAPGQLVTVTGSRFDPSLELAIEGTPVIPISVTGSTVTFINPGAVACTTRLEITNPGGATAGVPLVPVAITSLAPTSGPVGGGTLVSITGKGFSAAGLGATVGGAAATIVSVAPNRLVLRTPPGVAGPTTLDVDVPNGSSASTPFGYFVPPTITSISPLNPGTGVLVTVAGSDFDPGATIDVDGVPVTPATATPTALTFVQPFAATSTSVVTVTNTDGNGASASLVPAAINSVLPTSGPVAGGSSVAIAGPGLAGNVVATIGGVAAMVRISNANGLLLITPPGAPGSASIVLVAPNGSSVTSTFTYF